MCCASPGAKDFYEQTPSKDKDLKIYEGHQHDLLDGLESQKVIDDIVSWIKTRASKILAKDSFVPTHPIACRLDLKGHPHTLLTSCFLWICA